MSEKLRQSGCFLFCVCHQAYWKLCGTLKRVTTAKQLNIATEWLALVLRAQKVSGSNIDPESVYTG
jgi:hypothetical protein